MSAVTIGPLRRRNEDYTQDGLLIPSWTWNNDAAGDFVVGQYVVTRFTLDVPKGATVTSALFSYEYGQKDGNQVGTATLQTSLENTDNSARYPEALGASSTAARTWGYGQVNYTINHTVHTEGADLIEVNLTSGVHSMVNREGWESGNYISIGTYCTAVSGTRLAMQMRNNPWAYHPQLLVTYSYDDLWTEREDVNAHPVQHLTTSIPPASVNNGLSNENTFYDTRAQGTTWDLQPKGSPVGNGTALRVMANAPAGQETRAFGVFSYEEADVWEYAAFAGWFYNPSSNVGVFSAEFVFTGHTTLGLPQRDVWTPFCTSIYRPTTTGERALWMQVLVNKAEAGAHFYVDGLTLYRSMKPFPKLFPWTQHSPAVRGREYRHTDYDAQRGASVRRVGRATHVRVGGVTKPTSRWSRPFVPASAPLYVPADTRWPSVAARQPTAALGNVTLTPDVSYQGLTWTRVTANTAGHGVRTNVPLSRLVNGKTYTVSYLVANDGAVPVTVVIDWCDVSVAPTTVQPGQMLRLTTSGSLPTYTSTFRFADLSLPTAGASVLFADPRVVGVTPGGWNSVPDGRWMDIETAKKWADL